MDINRQPRVNNRQRLLVSSLSIGKEELRRLCDLLQERANSAAEIEVRLFQKNQQTDEEFETNKQTIRQSFLLKITVSGDDGEELWGSIEEVFASVNFPDSVASLFVDSEATLRHGHNYYPHNSFRVYLDFTKPAVFDFSRMPNQKTPNESNIEVKGYDATWVNGVFSEIRKFIDARSSALSFVHNHSVYDVLLWVVGFPISFWICWKLSELIESIFPESGFATSALYVYAFVGSLFIFRALFHYFRWVCPLVEFKSDNSRTIVHRVLLSTLVVAWVGQFMYDVVKWLIV